MCWQDLVLIVCVGVGVLFGMLRHGLVAPDLLIQVAHGRSPCQSSKSPLSLDKALLVPRSAPTFLLSTFKP